MLNETSPPHPPEPGDKPSLLSLTGIATLMMDFVVFLVIVLAPVVPYLKQYSIIRQKRDIGAFSIYVCAIVLYGQAFRILFW